MNLISILLQVAPAGARNYSGILFLLLIGFIIYYFVKIRPQKKDPNQVRQIETNPLDGMNLKWYQKPISIILFIIFFFPIGLILMWKNEIWTKQIRWIISGFFIFIALLNFAKNGNYNELVGKYYAENGRSYIELYKNGTFEWVEGGEVFASGEFTFNSKKENYMGYESYYSITTNATGGKYQYEWNATEGIRDWQGYYQLNQRISGVEFIFKKTK